MKHNKYFEWTELKPADHFRVAGYYDLFVKLNNREAKCLGSFRGGTKMARKNKTVQFGDNVGGLMLAISSR